MATNEIPDSPTDTKPDQIGLGVLDADSIHYNNLSSEWDGEVDYLVDNTDRVWLTPRGRESWTVHRGENEHKVDGEIRRDWRPIIETSDWETAWAALVDECQTPAE